MGGSAHQRQPWEVQPASETAASRKNRDLTQRGGDWNGAQLIGSGTGSDANLSWVPNSGQNAGKLVYDADGRLDREILRRGGEYYVGEDGEQEFASAGRNQREYANGETLVSAITNSVHPDAENFQGSPLSD